MCNLHIQVHILSVSSILFHLFLLVTGISLILLMQAGFPLICASSCLMRTLFHMLQLHLFGYCLNHSMSTLLPAYLLPDLRSFHPNLLSGNLRMLLYFSFHLLFFLQMVLHPLSLSWHLSVRILFHHSFLLRIQNFRHRSLPLLLSHLYYLLHLLSLHRNLSFLLRIHL